MIYDLLVDVGGTGIKGTYARNKTIVYERVYEYLAKYEQIYDLCITSRIKEKFEQLNLDVFKETKEIVRHF